MTVKIIQAFMLLSLMVVMTACDEMRNKDDNTQAYTSNSQVIIGAYQTYPTAEGCESSGVSLNKKDCYLLPNGTIGEVMEWNKKYTTKGSIFAQMDMFDESKVKIISGPASGKTLYVAHAYMTLK